MKSNTTRTIGITNRSALYEYVYVGLEFAIHNSTSTVHTQELCELHSKIYRQMLERTQQVMMTSSRTSRPAVCRLYQVFIDFKIDLLVYGEYCSNLPLAQSRADKIANSELYRTHIERAEKSYNDGKFKLREMLTIPLQRVLKYHLLLRVRSAA